MAVLKGKSNSGFLALAAVILLCEGLLIAAHSIPKEHKARKALREDDDSWMHPSAPRNPSRQKSLAAVDEGKEFWDADAQAKLQSKIRQRNIEAEAKNTIMFLGDGMSIPTVTAARIFKGQQEKLPNGGEEGELYFDGFPHTALSKTYCTDSQVADSACSATAYLCGVKGNIKTIGVTNSVENMDCDAQKVPANQVSSILAWAQAAGKSTGIISTARITHASPAGAYAHIAHRDWETDYNIESDGVNSDDCDDIAEQLILNEPGNKINVILGGGRQNFYDKTFNDTETGNAGYRSDGKNLVDTWQKNNVNGKYITSAAELRAIDTSSTDLLLGLFSPGHISYKDQIEADDDPSLAEMTRVAIEILSRNPKGYFLFVEGGRIDHAHHDNFGQRALVETMEFNLAISLADDLTNDDDTLLVVTSDHSHVMTINGYPDRGSPLLGISEEADDNMPYATLSYANGPGYKPAVYNNETGLCERYNITGDDFYNITYQQVTMALIDSETHGGDDVGIFAKGPWAHLFSGVVQQSYIPHAMAYAACIGDGAKYCDDPNFNSGDMLRSSFIYSPLLFAAIVLRVLS